MVPQFWAMVEMELVRGVASLGCVFLKVTLVLGLGFCHLCPPTVLPVFSRHHDVCLTIEAQRSVTTGHAEALGLLKLRMSGIRN